MDGRLPCISSCRSNTPVKESRFSFQRLGAQAGTCSCWEGVLRCEEFRVRYLGPSQSILMVSCRV